MSASVRETSTALSSRYPDPERLLRVWSVNHVRHLTDIRFTQGKDGSSKDDRHGSASCAVHTWSHRAAVVDQLAYFALTDHHGLKDSGLAAEEVRAEG